MNKSSASSLVKNPTFRLFILLALWLVTLGTAFLLGAYAYKHRATWISFLEPAGEIEFAGTSLYDVEISKIPSPAKGRDGGIAALDSGILLADGKGQLWFVDGDNSVEPLALRIPINRDEFESDPDNAEVSYKNRFAVKDILVTRLLNQLMLIASYNHWDQDNNCYTLRVSYTSTTNDVLEGQDNDAPYVWETVFESSPCLALSSISGSTGRRPTISAGGRLIRVSNNEILLSVGDFGSYNRGRAGYPQELGNSYGKTILIDIDTGDSRIFSIGQRNPQGLAITSDSQIWSTEHGPQGGDELNLIKEGKNYGFPYVTYGTNYGTSNWPLNARQGAHDSYEKPIFSWVPSIAPSQLIAIKKDLFALWEGDLIISSLAAQTLYRARIKEERVVLVETLRIGHRIRDITESSDGRIILKTDDDLLIFIQPVNFRKFDDFELSVRGKYLATQCQGCHTFNRGGALGIGPNLYQVIGKPIARKDNFEYSPALKAVGGRWTTEALLRFLKDPESFAPGTAMQTNASFTDEQVSSLVAYLETLR